MNKLIITLCIIVNPSLTFADDIVYLNKGTPSPSDGYLFSPAKTQTVKNQLLTIDDLRLQVASYQKSINLYKVNESEYQKEIDLFSTQNTKLINEQQTALSMSTYEKAGWFAGGLIASALAFVAASKVIKSQ